ncbi:hypothetical protein B0O99DRAFT_525975, partial [Bisporella sp. PMI_857]
FDINNELALIRPSTSSQTGKRVQAFCDTVRSRDKRCVITGDVALGAPGFESAHIFLLAYEKHCKNGNFARWISIYPTAGGSINSIQNGMLLRNDIHHLFDAFAFSINPDDGYKIVHFSYDSGKIAGKHLNRRLLDDLQRPVDELFRWHFRQAVLINMRGAGEPIFEHDFPPGSDIVGSILEGPKAAKRMEFGLFSRLVLNLM